MLTWRLGVAFDERVNRLLIGLDAGIVAVAKYVSECQERREPKVACLPAERGHMKLNVEESAPAFNSLRPRARAPPSCESANVK